MNTHLWGVLPASLSVLILGVLAWRTPALHPAMRGLAKWALALLVLQIILGVSTFRLHLQVEPLTVAHQTIGAALLGVLVCFTVLGLRDRHTSTIAIPSDTVKSAQAISQSPLSA